MNFDKVEITKVENGYIIVGHSRFEKEPILRVANDFDQVLAYLSPAPKVVAAA
jgi:adenosine/AMP kinase